MTSRLFRTIVLLFIVGTLSACSLFQSSPPTPFPTPLSTLISPNELFRTSGDGPLVTQSFVLPEDMRIRINWDQSSEGDFILTVFSLDPTDMQKQTGYDRVIFEQIVGPSAFYGDDDYTAGEYAIEIEAADGPWVVWVERIDFGQ